MCAHGWVGWWWSGAVVDVGMASGCRNDGCGVLGGWGGVGGLDGWGFNVQGWEDDVAVPGEGRGV
jgi:hypothetical protein